MTGRAQEIAALAEELRQHGAMWFRDGLLLKLNRLIEIAEAQQRELVRPASVQNPMPVMVDDPNSASGQSLKS